MKYYSFIGIIVMIILWFFITQLQFIDVFFLPNPFLVIEKLIILIISGEIIPDIFATIIRVLVSFIIAVAIGLPLGLFLGYAEKMYRSFEFIIDFFRSIPPLALFPLFLLIFGIGDESKVAVATFSSTLIIIFNTAYGVLHAKKSRLIAAKIMGASKFQIFRWILFYETLPQIVIGMKSGVSLSLIIIVVTEMFIGTQVGLGRKIIEAQVTYEIPMMYAIIILTGTIGYIFNLFFSYFEKKMLPWIQNR